MKFIDTSRDRWHTVSGEDGPMVTLTPARAARAMATTISSVLRVSISHWAGPPTRKVVKGANGT